MGCVTELMPKKIRKVVLREDLFALTKDTHKAIALGQLIYWSERTKDVDKFITEESARLKRGGIESNMLPSYGWIYKEAKEFIEETMLSISRPTANRLLNALVEDSYLFVRNNPDKPWDRTNQYRVNFVFIRDELRKLGYWHSEFAWLSNDGDYDDPSEMSNTMLKMSNAMINLSIEEIQEENPQKADSDALLNLSNRLSRNERAIPEITSKINNNDNNKRGHETQNLPINNQQENALEEYNHPDTGQDSIEPTKDLPAMTTKICEMIQTRMSVYTMSTNNPRMYRLSSKDYQEINSLLFSGVPSDFILSCIDYAFKHYPGKRNFLYCAEVVKTEWVKEQMKQATPKQINWDLYAPSSKPQRESGGRTSRMQSGTSTHTMTSMDERVVPAVQPGKYERFYQVYKQQGVDIGDVT